MATDVQISGVLREQGRLRLLVELLLLQHPNGANLTEARWSLSAEFFANAWRVATGAIRLPLLDEILRYNSLTQVLH